MTTLDKTALEVARLKLVEFFPSMGVTEFVATKLVTAYLDALSSIPAQPVGKYDAVLKPFVSMMEKELHANSGKGDRPGWLAMSREELLLEIYYHLAKLQKAALKDDAEGIREFGADVANMAMMLVDKCEQLPLSALTSHPAAVAVTDEMVERALRAYFGEYYDLHLQAIDKKLRDETAESMRAALEAALVDRGP
jgi:hypothetical protein